MDSLSGVADSDDPTTGFNSQVNDFEITTPGKLFYERHELDGVQLDVVLVLGCVITINVSDNKTKCNNNKHKIKKSQRQQTQ